MAAGLGDYLDDHGYDYEIATSGPRAVERFRGSAFDAVISDVRMPGMTGLELLDTLRAIDDAVPVLIMTAFGSIETAIEAVKRGAYHYFAKPLKTEEVLVFLGRAVEHRINEASRGRMLRDTQERYTFETLVGRSPAMRHIFDMVDRVADSTASVLVTGESGTGKELIARAIHFRGPRADRPMVPVNCAAIPENLLESELFGHEKGAFTGADRPRSGLAVEASGGTLFLDEIGEMPLELQPKILRLLQEGEVRPLGSNITRQVNVRVIAATNADMGEQVRKGSFRKDLFYRLNVVPIDVPPLRLRRSDIPILAERFLQNIRRQTPRLHRVQLSPDASDALMRYDWPGNVRELENVMERAATLCREAIITQDDLHFLDTHKPKGAVGQLMEGFPTMRELENRYLEVVLESVGGNKVKAAAILGVDPSTIYRRQKSG